MTIIPIKCLENRRIFFNSVKNTNETIDEWLERIEILAKSCGFSQDLNLFLFNKFLTGLDDGNFCKIVSQRNDLTLESSLCFLKKNDDVLPNPNTFNYETEVEIKYTAGDTHARNDSIANEQPDLAVK